MEGERDRFILAVVLDPLNQQVHQSGLLCRWQRFPQRVERLDGPDQFIRLKHAQAKPRNLGVDHCGILLTVLDVGLQLPELPRRALESGTGRDLADLTSKVLNRVLHLDPLALQRVHLV